MASLNRVMLIGNITRDPEVKYTPKGTAVCEIGLAVNRERKTDDGKQEETTFVDITAWGRQAEVIGQYSKKGHPLFIEGRLQLDTWDDKNTGEKRSKLKVVLESFQFLGGKESAPKQKPMTEQEAFDNDSRIANPAPPIERGEDGETIPF